MKNNEKGRGKDEMIELNEIFSLFDTEKKGEIDYREFVSELFGNKSLSKKKKSSQIEMEESAPKSEIKKYKYRKY